MIRKILFVLLVGVVGAIQAQELINANQGYVNTRDYFERIPYQNINGKIIIKVSIENQEYRFLLDTGAPTALSHQLSQTIKTDLLGMVPMSDQSGIIDSVTIASVPEIIIQGISFKDTPAFIENEGKGIFFECLQIDGIIGSNQLRNTIVQFNSQKSEVVFTDQEKALGLKKKNAIDIQLSPIQSNPFLPVTYVKGMVGGNDWALIDSGDNGFLLVSQTGYNQLKEQVDVFNVLAESTGSLSMGVWGSAQKNMHELLEVPELRMGDVSFLNTQTETTYAETSRVGSELFEYAVVTIDYPGKRCWITPVNGEPKIDMKETFWPVRPVLNNDNQLVVGIVWDASLAETIKPGDVILSFDTLDYRNIPYCDILNASFKVNKSAAVLVLQDKDTGEEKKVEIKKMSTPH